MSYIVYIIKNKDSKYYIGYTQNIDDRLAKHNSGATKSTKYQNTWEVVYREFFKEKSEAINREKYIKKQKSKKFIEKLIDAG